MKITRFGAFVLLLTSGLTAGCASQLDGNDINTKYGDANQASTKRVSGSSISVCTDVGGTVYGLDDDSDSLAVIAEMSDIFSDNASGYADYVCIDTSVSGGPKNYIVISDDSWISLDCDDDDAAIGSASVAEYADTDSDGYGDAASSDMVCGTLDVGYVADSTDCDDTDGAINPGAIEMCDGVDNDCAGGIDDGLVITTWYADTDGDTYGDPAVSTSTCDTAVPTGWSADNEDCDDTDGGINPGGTEVADDGIDQDCDGSDLVTPDPDADGDGFPASTDCNDGDATINPDAVEILDNSVDEDCSGVADMTPTVTDVDGDGFDSLADGGTDCDDTDPLVNTSMAEVSLDGVDNNCDGMANASDTVEVCGTPVAGLIGTSWQLWLRDGTMDPDGSTTVTWALPGANQGIGELCASTVVTDGNDEDVNGPFDLDGDGTYGELDVDGDGVWGYMLDATNLDAALFTANGYSITVSANLYGSGADGIWIVDLL